MKKIIVGAALAISLASSALAEPIEIDKSQGISDKGGRDYIFYHIQVFDTFTEKLCTITTDKYALMGDTSMSIDCDSFYELMPHIQTRVLERLQSKGVTWQPYVPDATDS